MKKRKASGMLVFLLVWPLMWALASADGFDRYLVILETKPFGEPPPEPVKPPPPAEETPPWAKAYRLCSVYQAAGEPIEVALLDLKTNKPVMLTLGGEASEGIELISADVDAEEATLMKEGLTVTMQLEASKKPPPKPAPRKPGQRRVRKRVAQPATPQQPNARPGAAPTPRRRGVIRAKSE